MSDLAKCIAILALVGGAWFYTKHRGAQEKKFDAPAAKGLVMVQGKKPEPGQPVLLEFWATWCGPCVQNIPHMNELYAKYQDQVQFIGVTSEDAGTVKTFMQRMPMRYPVAVDGSGEFLQAWNVKGIPDAILLGPDHTEIWRGHPGQLTPAKLGSLLK